MTGARKRSEFERNLKVVFGQQNAAGFCMGACQKPVARNLDERLHEWFVSEYEKKLAVSRKRLITKSNEIHAQLGEAQELQFSKGWLDRFLTPYGMTLRSTTTIPVNVHLQTTKKNLFNLFSTLDSYWRLKKYMTRQDIRLR